MTLIEDWKILLYPTGMNLVSRCFLYIFPLFIFSFQMSWFAVYVYMVPCIPFSYPFRKFTLVSLRMSV